MADDNSERDLFGEAVQDAARGRGRPPHAPSRETTNRVILGFARGWTVKKVAQSIGVSVPTLRQYYFSHVQRREQLALMMESVQLGRLNDLAAGGNVSAEKELMKALSKGRVAEISAAYAGEAPAPPKAPKLGKKEAAVAGAKNAKGKFAPPAGPQLIN